MRKLSLLIFLLIFSISACDDDSTNDLNLSSLKTEVVENYATIVYQSYIDSYNLAVDLQTAIDNFVATPTATNFALAKNAWLAARTPYGQTEVYRFYNGPIDNETTGPEGDMNAWPLNEAFIDYVEGQPNGGIVNDGTITITEEYLRNNNAKDVDEVNVAIGYHAIEFLLWGQDSGDASQLTSGARAYTDYTTADNASRRGTYLKLCAAMLVDDLQTMVDAWKPSSSNYRSTFVADADVALANILTGMGSLSRAELSGERMDVALVNHDQEDEHSCFSDNTHTDIVMNAKGIQNVYLGTYVSSTGTLYSGKCIADLVDALDTDLNTKMTNELTVTMEKLNNIQAPFDFEISSGNSAGNARVQAGIDALDEQTNTIQEVADLLELQINTAG